MSTPEPSKDDTKLAKKAPKSTDKATKKTPQKSTAEDQKSADATNNGANALEHVHEKPTDLGNKKQEEKPSKEKTREKRDILKLLRQCERTETRKGEDKCCTWHKYVLYALPLAAYLPWLLRVSKCPPRCCPPKYCCPCNCEPFCPPSKLACGPKQTGCQRLCPPEANPCAEKEPQCKESDKYSV